LIEGIDWLEPAESSSSRCTVVAALALLGASSTLLVAALHAASRDNAQDGHPIYSLLRLLTFSLDVPLALIALASGVLLALTSKWGIFRY
jgi:hypothetical protein